MRYTLRNGTIEAGSPRDWLRLAAAYRLQLQPSIALGRIAGLAGLDGRLTEQESKVARRLLRSLRVDLRVTGADAIETGRQYVVAPLHESAIDPVAILQLPMRLRFAIRDEIFDWRQIGGYLRAGRHVAIAPERRIASARRLRSLTLSAGESIVLFPQGTVLGIETAFQAGPFWLAARLGLPVLPVVLTGTHRVWEYPFRPTVRLGETVAMHVLPAIEPGEITADNRAEVVARAQRDMKDIALDGDRPTPRRFVPERDGYWDGYRYDIDPRFPEMVAAVRAHRERTSGPSASRQVLIAPPAPSA